jgi:hypothetical protein
LCGAAGISFRAFGLAAAAPQQYAENGDHCRCIDAHRQQHDRELAFEASRPSIEANLFS